MKAPLAVLVVLSLTEPELADARGPRPAAVAGNGGSKQRATVARRGYGMLIGAVERGDTLTVKALIKRGVDVNGRDVGNDLSQVNRPIVTAAAKGRLDLVNVLLDAGADPNACCCSCVAALHEAIRGGHVAIVARLLDGGANPRLLYDSAKSPLDLAWERGSHEMVVLLEKRLAAAVK